jgi:hypothetical protein
LRWREQWLSDESRLQSAAIAKLAKHKKQFVVVLVPVLVLSSSSIFVRDFEHENENEDEDESGRLGTFRFLPRRLLLNILSVSVSSDRTT